MNEVPGARPIVFRLWGAVEAYQNGQRVDMGSPRERCLLVGLIAARGKPVPRSSLLEWIWDDLPRSASDDLGALMTKLRKGLDRLGLGDKLNNKDGLCQFDIEDDVVDAHRASEIAATPKASDQQAAKMLGEALRLTDGEPLAGLSTKRIDGYRTALKADLLAMKVAYNQAEIRLGRHRERVGELLRLLEEHPDDSTVAGLAMCALYLAGRQQDALGVYRRHRTLLNDEFGVDVAADLTGLQERILRDDLRPDSGSFPLGRPYSANGEPTMEEGTGLLVAVRPDTGSPDDMRAVIAESFREVTCPARSVDGCLIYSVPPDVPATQVVGVWMDRLYRAVAQRAQVGIAIGGARDVCDLARSEYARRMLDAAPDSRLAVTVSEDVYERAVLPRGRKVSPDAYRRTDGDERGWVCIPGRSTPPHPVDETEESPRQAPMGTPSRIVVKQKKVKLRDQYIGSVHNEDRRRS
jgi:DNA-binding SARP family transcriptional activator